MKKIISILTSVLMISAFNNAKSQTIYNQNGGSIQPSITTTSTNVGINFNNPQYGLHIGGSPSAPTLMLDGHWTTNHLNHGRLMFNDQNFGIGAGNFGSSGDDDLYLWTYGTSAGRDIRFMSTTNGNSAPSSASWSTNMIIKRGGQVGIGTVNPWSQFQVMGSRHNDFVTFSNSYPFVQSAATLIFGGYSTAQPEANNPMLLQLYGTTNLTAGGTDSHDRLRVFNNGEVLIGEADLRSGYKLFVEEGILTEKLKVAVRFTGNWSDYVFDSEYKLMPLKEVEDYVIKNQHLPGVPSAEEVVENGIDVATMDAKLLEKIEELTLYLIEMKKENKKLQTRIEKLENQL